MPTIAFPYVPAVAGVPVLARDASNTLNDADIAIAATDSVQLSDQQINFLLADEWAILDSSGNKVITPDTFIAFEYRDEQKICSYPVDPNSFSSYNKIPVPIDARLTLACSGQGAMTREQFLSTLDTMKAALDLYTITTPDASYPSLNVVHYDYSRRSNQHAVMVVAEVWFQEVRVTATSTYTQTQQPDGASPVSGGLATPQPATTAQQTAVNNNPVS